MNVIESFKLYGRRALVTGSSRGIGAAIAYALAEAGADVVVHYVGGRDPAEALADKIRALGRRSGAIAADLSRAGDPERLFDAAVDTLGGLDILVSNVAVQIPEPWHAVTPEHFTLQMRTNWQSGFELIQRAAPGMLAREWGRIVTIGSVQEAWPHPEMVVYAALKAAQTLMVSNLARQFAARGVTVNNLAPGTIETDRNTSRLADPAYAAKVVASIPAGYVGKPEDCVGAALLLCSEAGRYITGQQLYVDGGMGL